jgi:hypothetical protein
MSFLTKYLGGWQLYAIIATAALSAGFYGGMRWEKGANLADAERSLEELSVQAQEALVTLGLLWEAEASRAQLQVEKWNLQNQADQLLALERIAVENQLWREFNEINAEIEMVTEFGICQFSPNSIRLLRESSEKARAASMPKD